jgi:hypothetical protein
LPLTLLRSFRSKVVANAQDGDKTHQKDDKADGLEKKEASKEKQAHEKNTRSARRTT